MLMIQRCAWCGRTEGFKEITCFNGEGKEPVTHTICPICKKKVETDILSFSLFAHPSKDNE